jgi:plastocyanin
MRLSFFLPLLAAAATRLSAAEIDVIIIDHEYVPPRVSINAGDTVRWIANTPEHTVSADRGEFDSAEIWDIIPEGETYSVTFDTPGVYPYFCLTHGGPGGTGMSGVVTVFSGASNRPPAVPRSLQPGDQQAGLPLQVMLSAAPFSDPDPGDSHAASQWVVRNAASGAVVHDSGEDAVGLTNHLTAALFPGAEHEFQVRFKDARGAWSGYSAPSRFRTVGPLRNEAAGLQAEYFNAPSMMEAKAAETNAAIDFDWGEERPHRRVTAPDFAIRWTGHLLPSSTGEHRIHLRSRGGVRLWLNQDLLIASAACGALQDHSAIITLGAGKLAALRLEFLSPGADPLVQMRWSMFDRPLEPILADRFFLPSTTQEP